MQEKVIETESRDSGDLSDEDLRTEIYAQLGVTKTERLGIRHILPILELFDRTETRYDIDARSKILAEIALIRAYIREPKFKMFAQAAALLATYDFLYPLEPAIYGILLGALVTLNGFIASLRSPAMMAAELEGAKDEDGMPAHYRAKAFSSVNTNVTLVLFLLAVGIQVLVTSSLVQGELLTENIADGALHPVFPAFVLGVLPLLYILLPRGSGN